MKAILTLVTLCTLIACLMFLRWAKRESKEDK